MISVIVYGRNDDHGHNYHKRLAISLNCLAEVLTESGDEILFVDYNSSNELPTVVQAIQDTLTDKAKKLIRIFRVRHYHHARFKTHRPMLESVARNVAIRRSSPRNKWILSTNIDMIFVSQENKSLSEIVASLEDGFYSLPRFELPENLWELALKRLDPTGNISFLREQGQILHLNTIVRREGFLQYDNPGDFQLMLRKDIVEIGGFDEAMVKGWHIDSNLSRRMFLLKKTGGSLENLLKGYHCNHTLKKLNDHRYQTKNNWNRFVNNVALSPIANGSDWGLINEDIEEITLGSGHHLKSITAILSCFPKRDYEVLHDIALYNHPIYSTPRIFTYLMDHLMHVPKSINIVYIGHNKKLIRMIESYLKENHYTGRLLFSQESQASLYIFDFGFDENAQVQEKKELKQVMKAFLRLMSHKKSLDPHAKFIGINTKYTDFDVLLSKHLSMPLSSYITGSSCAYVPVEKSDQKTFPSLKKKLIFLFRYLLVRYFFKYSDQVRRLLLRTKLSKILFTG
jgi:hypothetical protein